MIPWVDARAVVPGAWDTFRAEMLLKPARYIVDTSPGEYRAYGNLPPEGAPSLRTLIERRYHLATTILEEGKPAFRIFELGGDGKADIRLQVGPRQGQQQLGLLGL